MSSTKTGKHTSDFLDYYTFGEHDKHMFSGHSGKGRSKREAELRSNRNDPSGHSRKISTKLRNTERNHNHNNSHKSILKTMRSKKLNSPKKQRVVADL
ncbi:hypothetical protein TYRP_018578 [Tyrophagus putrescentiae]|nr:hypothetical protein TYRP_018578 [Tyrophagus putrescentiae]